MAALAVGQQPMTYQWQFNGEDITGATDAMLVLSNLTADAAGSYQCVVSNSIAAITCPAARVEVPLPPPRFDTSAGAIRLDVDGLHVRLLDLGSRGDITVEISTNLVDWMLMTNLPPSLGVLDIVDPSAVLREATYYRATEGP